MGKMLEGVYFSGGYRNLNDPACKYPATPVTLLCTACGATTQKLPRIAPHFGRSSEDSFPNGSSWALSEEGFFHKCGSEGQVAPAVIVLPELAKE